jgi:hypothetical protein
LPFGISKFFAATLGKTAMLCEHADAVHFKGTPTLFNWLANTAEKYENWNTAMWQ